MIVNKYSNGGSSSGGTYVLPVATTTRLGGIKVGSGLTIDSGGTLSSEGGSGGGPKVVYLNQLSKQERKALYDEIVAYSTADNFPAGDYRFLNYNNEDVYTGYYEMFVSKIASTVTFSAIFKGRSNTKVLIKTSRIFSDGDWSNDVSQTGDFPYTLPAASDSALGGIKVGSGLSIDNQGVLSVSGGSSDSNYVIVDALSAITNPVEGMMAQVRSYSSQTEYYKLYVTDRSVFQNGWFGRIDHPDLGDRNILLDGGHFYWDWEDNRYPDWADGDWDGNTYKYRWDGESPEFDIIFPEGSDLSLSATYYSEEQYDYVDVPGVSTGVGSTTEWHLSQPYIYQKDTWIPVYRTYVKSDIEGFSTSAETAAFVNDVLSQIEAGRAPLVYDDEHNAMMVLDSYGNDYVIFYCDKGGTTNYIACSATKHEEDEYNARGIKTWDNGWYSAPENPQTFYVYVVDASGNLGGDPNYIRYADATGNEYYRIWFGSNYDQSCQEECERGGSGQLKWVNRYKTSVHNEDSGEDEIKWYYVFSADVPVGTTIYTGVWGIIDDEGVSTIETLSWTSGATWESQNYPVYTGSTGE